MFAFTFYEIFNKVKKCKSVKAVSSYEGKTVIGVADLHPEDEYNYEKGREIARLRCQKKLCKKKINRFKRKQAGVKEDVAWYSALIRRLDKRAGAYAETIRETEKLMAETDAKLNELLNN